MTTILPIPGTPEAPAPLGQPVALLAQPLLEGTFGPLEGKVELVPGGAAPIAIPPDAVEWTERLAIARLPAQVPSSETFKVRVSPPAGQPIESPITLLQSVEDAVADLASRLEIAISVGGRRATQLSDIEARPEEQPIEIAVEPTGDAGFQVLSAPAPPSPVAAPPPRGGAAASAPARPATKAPANVGPGSRPRAGTRPGQRPVTVQPAGPARPRPPKAGPKPVPRPAAGATASGGPRDIGLVVRRTVALTGLPAAVTAPLAGAQIILEARLDVTGFEADEIVADPLGGAVGFALAAAPKFVEPRSGSPRSGDVRQLGVRARVTVEARFPTGPPIRSDQVDVPAQPVPIGVLPLQVPTILALFRHREYDPLREEETKERSRDGFAFLVVPETTPIAQTAEQLSDVIRGDLLDTASQLVRTLKRIPVVARALARIELLNQAVSTQPWFALRKGHQTNLNQIEMINRGGLTNDTEVEDQPSAMLVLGRPGTVAELYCRRDFKGDEGRFTVRLGDPDELLPLQLAAFPRLPATPAPSLTGLDLDGVDLGGVDDAIVVERNTAPTRRDNVFADTIRSLKLFPGG